MEEPNLAQLLTDKDDAAVFRSNNDKQEPNLVIEYNDTADPNL